MELDDEDRALLRPIRHQRDVFTSREPPNEDSAILVNLLVMAMEAIEIYIIIRYTAGREACLELMMTVGRLCGFQSGAAPDPGA
ncbi:MAG: hypothetical protein GY719_09980 [bacterium]|nr:hypothetical protein [bacterium]